MRLAVAAGVGAYDVGGLRGKWRGGGMTVVTQLSLAWVGGKACGRGARVAVAQLTWVGARDVLALRKNGRGQGGGQ